MLFIILSQMIYIISYFLRYKHLESNLFNTFISKYLHLLRRYKKFGFYKLL